MNDNVKTLRCSVLDGLFACPPSVLDESGLVRLSTAGEAAELGKVVHALAASYIETGSFDLKGECARRGFEAAEEAAGLLTYAAKAWDELKRFFKQPKTERVVNSDMIEADGTHYQLTGTCDVLSPVGDKGAIFADWKSGYLDEGYHQQMFGYAYCLWCLMGRPEEAQIVGVVVFLRHRYYRIVKYDANQLREWERDLKRNVLPRSGTYHPGGQCARCGLYAGCEARRQLVGGTLQALMLPHDLPADDPHRRFLSTAQRLLSGLTVDNKDQPEVQQALTELRFRLKLAKKVIEDAEELQRRAVERVGPIPLADDTHLALRNTEQKVIDPLRAMKCLRSHLSDQDIADCMRLSLPKLKLKKAGKYLRGEKRAATEQLEKELESAGAINVSIRQRLEAVDLSTESEKADESVAPDVRPGQPATGAVAGAAQRGGQRQVVRGGGGPGAVDPDAGQDG
jgi:hypothetical protein